MIPEDLSRRLIGRTALWMARIARSESALSMSTESLISLVEIMWMLMCAGIERLKHLGGHARIALHARAHDGHLGIRSVSMSM